MTILHGWSSYFWIELPSRSAPVLNRTLFQGPSGGAPVLNRTLFQGPSRGRYIPWVVFEEDEWGMGSDCRRWKHPWAVLVEGDMVEKLGFFDANYENIW